MTKSHIRKKSQSEFLNTIRGKSKYKPKLLTSKILNNNNNNMFSIKESSPNSINEDIDNIDRSNNISIGIRLGQRWCSVSAIENDEISDIIHKVPTLVTFTKTEIYYGTDAIRQSIANISNSVYGFFGLLGRRYNDRFVQECIKHTTYKIIKIDYDKHTNIKKFDQCREEIGIPILHTKNKEDIKIYTIIEIVGQFLEHIMDQVNDKLGVNVKYVGISVSNTFGQQQRIALMQACKLAKINNVRLVTSCLAASVYYKYYDNKKENNFNNNHNIIFSKKKYNKKNNNSELRLIADISNIACSLSIIQTQKSKSGVVLVQNSLGNERYGIWNMVNNFSVYVLQSFLSEYKKFYRPNLIYQNKKERMGKHRNRSSIQLTMDDILAIKKHAKKSKKEDDTKIYSELEEIETIELEELNSKKKGNNDNDNNEDEYDDDDEDNELNNEDNDIKEELSENNNKLKKEESEVLKCRFRSQMLCGNVIEHLHDRYSEEIQIHYEKFYRQYSLQLLLTSTTLKKIALNEFVFNIHQSIDYIMQQCTHEYKDQLSECIIIGDGANIPEIKSLFSEYFLLNTSMDSSYPIIARGCAVSAAVDNEIMDSPLALQTLPKTIKMEEPSLKNCLTTVIQNELGCPCKRTVTRFTYKDNQTEYNIKFYEGESSNINKCTLIGKYKIIGIKSRKKLETKLIICMHIDRNCILVVSAEDATNSPPINLTVNKIL